MSKGSEVFRAEALAHLNAGASDAEILRLPRAWLRLTFWLTAAITVAVAAFLVLGTAEQYSAGPAVVVGSPGAHRVIALLPGRDRPRLQVGMTMQVSLTGFPGARQTVTLESIDDEVLGPSAMRRRLGEALADELPLGGAMVRVEARLGEDGFRDGAMPVRLYPGLTGRAEVVLRRSPLIVQLFPWLEGWRSHG